MSICGGSTRRQATGRRALSAIRIRFKDRETEKTLIFLTNLFGPPPLTICGLYKARWQVELFFKWIKQYLRIKNLYGTSENAVMVQIWTAVSVYVLVAITKKRLDLDASLYTLIEVFSVTLFERISLNNYFFDTKYILEDEMIANQLSFSNNSPDNSVLIYQIPGDSFYP